MAKLNLKSQFYQVFNSLNSLKGHAFITAKFFLNELKKSQFVTIKGIKIPIIEDLPENTLKALYGGYYERFELKVIGQTLEASDRVLELGTGLGLISSFCAKKIGNDRVFTYEANPGLEPIIRQTYALNHVSPHLKLCILGKEIGEQTFYVSESLWDSSLLEYSPDLQAVQVPVKCFNEEVKIVDPSFLVLDIEGGEYEFFQYANLHNIRKISMELHEDLIGEEKAEFVRSHLTLSGFTLNLDFSYRDRELFWER
ncbi:FkbM family methyltransferase [Planktothrix sp. FACHB-1365]|uniref:FkbM family methyltransferase n=1 Tax=Planktothrix sp. FACHB-1365 TaxID=2692855 RepID=UPI0016836B5C|nr:FkbM family methyltransferase [Planktothrix sp. FACHB-1365]MBD2482374.1 FkbM family methyltransferase [Planktothrix sp. FACHB-1365]